MEINDKLISKLAELAKLKFNKKAKEVIKSDLKNILVFINKLKEINTEKVNPLVYLTEEINILREDVVNEACKQTEALKNSPLKDSDYFKVPTVLKK
tara:strand:- start:104 stop:394 length:291 start_codon:yes stop_codon:yes gene_type:complete